MATENSNARALLKYLAQSCVHGTRSGKTQLLKFTGWQACFGEDLGFTTGFNEKQTHRILNFLQKLQDFWVIRNIWVWHSAQRRYRILKSQNRVLQSWNFHPQEPAAKLTGFWQHCIFRVKWCLHFSKQGLNCISCFYIKTYYGIFVPC